MGLFDSIKDSAASALGAEQHGALASAAAQVLGSQQSGGLGGLVTRLTQGGLGDAVQSWVGTGANQPVSPDGLQHAVGADQIAQIAAKAGISPEMAKAGLATLLPILIDKATPHGQIPAGGGDLASGLGGLLSSLGGKSV